MKIHHYTAVFQKESEGGYTVVIPALKGCVTYGKTIEEASVAAKEAIESYLGSLVKDGEAPPDDVKKGTLSAILREAGIEKERFIQV